MSHSNYYPQKYSNTHQIK